jgi:short-subunit dehydrogenase
MALMKTCNSAGFGTGGPFYTLPSSGNAKRWFSMLALMELTHAALPGMAVY